jgi:hypothetical protein
MWDWYDESVTKRVLPNVRTLPPPPSVTSWESSSPVQECDRIGMQSPAVTGVMNLGRDYGTCTSVTGHHSFWRHGVFTRLPATNLTICTILGDANIPFETELNLSISRWILITKNTSFVWMHLATDDPSVSQSVRPSVRLSSCRVPFGTHATFLKCVLNTVINIWVQ